MSHDPSRTPTPAFPALTPANHRVTSPATPAYNCIAWACRDENEWWQPDEYWPIPSDPRDARIENLTAALVAVGFVICPDATPEYGFETIAVYATDDGEYTHAARLLASGAWTSKLGSDVDIEHDTPEAVAGGVYGAVVGFMKRPLPA